MGTMDYMRRNQVQIFFVIKCIEASQVTLATQLAPSLYYNMDYILFMGCKLKNLTRASKFLIYKGRSKSDTKS